MCKFCKGMIIGLAVGAGVLTAVNPPEKKDIRTMKRRAKRALRSVEDAADGLCCKMR